jgi:hypothetical protein
MPARRDCGGRASVVGGDTGKNGGAVGVMAYMPLKATILSFGVLATSTGMSTLFFIA